MQISLKPEHEKFIQALIATGRYTDTEAAIDAAFQLLVARERQIEELRQKIAIGTEQIAKGQVTDGEIVFAKLLVSGYRNLESLFSELDDS